ncbi:MAG: hypothetical protein Q4D55_09830 [Eubacteriales bacterium]|nr:hypothetical protein [Eubacteriales bacterium]
MRKLTTHSRSGLFLMEMILSILFLSLSCSVCIRIFFAAHVNQKRAREQNHIQALVTSSGEILEGTDGSPEAFLRVLPGGEKKGSSLFYHYNRSWEPCTSDKFFYRLEIRFSPEPSLKKAKLLFSDREDSRLYDLSLQFWDPSVKKEEQA